MKKSLLIVALLSMIGVASAVEVGVNGGYTWGGPDRATYGVSVGEKFGKYGVAATFDRATATKNDQNRWGLVGSYDVATIAGVTVAPKLGVAWLDNQHGADGWAASVGVGASYPVTKSVALTADYRYQEDIQKKRSEEHTSELQSH